MEGPKTRKVEHGEHGLVWDQVLHIHISVNANRGLSVLILREHHGNTMGTPCF